VDANDPCDKSDTHVHWALLWNGGNPSHASSLQTKVTVFPTSLDGVPHIPLRPGLGCEMVVILCCELIVEALFWLCSWGMPGSWEVSKYGRWFAPWLFPAWCPPWLGSSDPTVVWISSGMFHEVPVIGNDGETWGVASSKESWYAFAKDQSEPGS